MHRNLYEIVLKICLLVHDSKFCLSLFSVRYGLCLEGGADLLVHYLYPQISGITWKMCSLNWNHLWNRYLIMKRQAGTPGGEQTSKSLIKV